MTEVLRKPALELGRMVREGETTARALVEASLARIDATNALLNAYPLVDADRALAAADAVAPGDPRPFAGVPIAIKDLTAVEGMPITLGSDFLGDHRQRLRHTASRCCALWMLPPACPCTN